MIFDDPLVSIHDVMPNTMSRVQMLIDAAASSGVQNLTLLVVPGLSWTPHDLETLRRWQDKGLALAGHGWVHNCASPKSWYHRLHSLLLSRNVAEHLSCQNVRERIALVQRCGEWFEGHRLGMPHLYVPPAWALGIPQDEFAQLPFCLVETLTGVADCRTGTVHRLPLLGFEADTKFRRLFVAGFNRANAVVAGWGRQPVRVSIHPYDLELLLADDLRRCLRRCGEGSRYDRFLDREPLLTPSVTPRSNDVGLT